MGQGDGMRKTGGRETGRCWDGGRRFAGALPHHRWGLQLPLYTPEGRASGSKYSCGHSHTRPAKSHQGPRGSARGCLPPLGSWGSPPFRTSPGVGLPWPLMYSGAHLVPVGHRIHEFLPFQVICASSFTRDTFQLVTFPKGKGQEKRKCVLGMPEF